MIEEIQRFQPKSDDIVHSASNDIVHSASNDIVYSASNNIVHSASNDIIYSTLYNIIHFASNKVTKCSNTSLALLQKIKFPFDPLKNFLLISSDS